MNAQDDQDLDLMDSQKKDLDLMDIDLDLMKID